MQRSDRVFIFGLDGAGNAVRDVDTPHLKALFARGAVTYHGKTAFPSISGQCWGSMFHGVQPELHGLTNDIVSTQPYPEDSPYPSFMKLARQKWPSAALASLSGWGPINAGMIEPSAGCFLASDADEVLIDLSVQYVKQHKDNIKLFYLQLEGPDRAGHGYGYWTDEFYRAVELCDQQIGRILEAINQEGLMDDSLIISLSDHGGGGANPKSHGSDQPKDMDIYWGCAGPGVAQGVVIKDELRIWDTAAVVAESLGLDAPTEWQARVPDGIFQDIGGNRFDQQVSG